MQLTDPVCKRRPRYPRSSRGFDFGYSGHLCIALKVHSCVCGCQSQVGGEHRGQAAGTITVDVWVKARDSIVHVAGEVDEVNINGSSNLGWSWTQYDSME